MPDLIWTCPCCAEMQAGLPALAFTTPGHLDRLKPWQRIRQGGFADELYVDRTGGSFYVRCVLKLPIVDAGSHLEWGVWSSLSKKNFRRYRDTINDGDQAKLGSLFGWFSSHCPGYPETFGLKCSVLPQNERHRPLIELEPTDHPLSLDQRNGITKARALELASPWLKLMGHEV